MRARTKNLNVRTTPDEYVMLEDLAEAIGMSISDVVRQLVRREHGARVAPTKKASKR